MPPFKLTINGRASISRIPEVVVVSLSAKTYSVSRETAMHDIQAVSDKLHDLIAPLATTTESGAPAPDAPIIIWHSTPIVCRTGPRIRDGFATTTASAPASTQASPQNRTRASSQGPTMTIYSVKEASFHAEVTFRNVDSLRDFMDELAQMPRVTVYRIFWDLLVDTHKALRAEIRGRALDDAINNAKDSAAHLGYEVVPVNVKLRRVMLTNQSEMTQLAALGHPNSPGITQLRPPALVFTTTTKVTFRPA